MLARYHAAVLAETVGRHVSADALRQIVGANLGQDSIPNQIGKPHLHFDNCAFAEGLAYIESQHAVLAGAADPQAMRAAFGRLSHAAQDFYSHSNYVDLWLARNGGLARTRPEDIDGLDPDLLDSPDLRSGYFYLWRDFIYYLPGLRGFARTYLVFANSHQAMHLDSPDRGPRFGYSIEAARQRTLTEYRRAIQALGQGRAALFNGL